MKKSSDQFIRRSRVDLRNIQNEAINDLQFCWKQLKCNFQTLFLIGGKIFDYF